MRAAATRDPDRRPTAPGYHPAPEWAVVCDRAGCLVALTPDDIAAHDTFHAQLAELAATLKALRPRGRPRATAPQAAGAHPGPPPPPPAAAGPGPGDHQPAAADGAPPPSPEDYPSDADAPQGREAEAEAGQPDTSSPAPGRGGTGPVFAACIAAGLSPGVARLFLTKQLPTLFGPTGQHPLPTISEIDTIPGNPQDRRTLAWAALHALARQFTSMTWPQLPEGD